MNVAPLDWLHVFHSSGVNVAAFLDELTPLAAVAQHTRCLAHFSTFLMDPWTSLTEVLCVACHLLISCDVAAHEHILFGAARCPGMRYRGLCVPIEDHEDGEKQCETQYLWIPREDMLLCENCSTSHEPDQILETWRQTRVEMSSVSGNSWEDECEYWDGSSTDGAYF